MKNGNDKKTEAKPKRSMHDYKPKKRYTRAEREKIEAGMLLLELIRRGQEENEPEQETAIQEENFNAEIVSEAKIMRNGNGKKKEAETKPKPKYSVHDYKPKKRYTRAEREKMELGAEFMEIIRKSLEKNEQAEKTDV